MVKAPFALPPLPPNVDYGPLVLDVSRANRAIGELNGLLNRFHNPDLLTSPLMTKEAVLSSRIEGTQATLEDVLKYDAEGRASQADAMERDIVEIKNYRQAMGLAIEELKTKPAICESLIKDIHFTLLDSVRGANKDRGNLRRIQVYIGLPGTPIEEARYVPPLPVELPALLSNWENFINLEEGIEPLIQIGIAHYQFEAIHPFMDGNGRIGRLLIPLFLYERHVLSHPVLYVSEYFEENRRQYYDLLNAVSGKEDWHSWLRFFLEALTIQAQKASATISEIFTLYDRLKEQVAGFSSLYAVPLLDVIFANPIISYVTIKELLGPKSQTTIYVLLSKFEEAGILVETSGKKRNRLYEFAELLRLLRYTY